MTKRIFARDNFGSAIVRTLSRSSHQYVLGFLARKHDSQTASINNAMLFFHSCDFLFLSQNILNPPKSAAHHFCLDNIRQSRELLYPEDTIFYYVIKANHVIIF